jgi:hypothetical protein
VLDDVDAELLSCPPDGALGDVPPGRQDALPVTVRRDGRSDLRGKTAPCPECGREVDRRGMKNHIEWVHRGNPPPWRKVKRR